MMPSFTTACPRNCYSTCALRVEIEQGQIRRIEADPNNPATATGPCLKGLSQAEQVRAADRLLHPLRRRPGGGFERIGWPDAIDLIAEQLQRLQETHGPQSLLYYAGSGSRGLLNRVGLDLWRLWGGCTTTYGDLCWPAGLEATRLTLGDNLHSAPWDLARARLIVLWGKNPAATNIHQLQAINQAQTAGARLVVIDPRRTESAEAADLLVQPRPGSDGALALGIIHLLFASNQIDHDFVDRHVLGAGKLQELVQAYPPARVAELTGVPAQLVQRLAEEIGSVKPLTICAGFGMQRYSNGGQTVRAMIALLALTGNLGTPGAGWVYANLASHLLSSPKDPLALYPPAEPGPVRVSISTALLGEQMLAQQDPPLRMAWIERGNPVSQNPATQQVLRALRRLDFRVVVDLVLTDTAREADLVLPAKTMFEQTDVLTAYWHPYLQLRQKLLDPPAEVKPETEIYYLLAERLGLDAAGIIPAPEDQAVEAWLEQQLAAFPELRVGVGTTSQSSRPAVLQIWSARLRETAGVAQATSRISRLRADQRCGADGMRECEVVSAPTLSLERLRQGPALAPGAPEVAWADHRFPTPSGKVELLSAEAAARWGVDPLPTWQPPLELPSETYPLCLLTPNSKNRIHSQLLTLPSLRELSPYPVVVLNAADAAARGINDGDRVRVRSSRGSLQVSAILDHSLRPGCVVIENGWWLGDGAAVNLLSAARETDMGHGAAFHDVAVQVERLGGGV